LANIDIERYLKISPPIAAHGHVATAEFEMRVNDSVSAETPKKSSPTPLEVREQERSRTPRK